MTTLYNRKGEPVEVPEAQVPAALQSGELGTLKTDRVQIVNPTTGGSGTVEAKDLAALPEGWRPETAQEGELREAKREYGGLGSSVRQAVESGLGAATSGASDVVAAELLGDSYREARRKRELANPNAALLGEIGGVVVPIGLSALTGGASGVGAGARLARALSAPTRAALGAGELAATGTRLASRALLGESTLARAVGRLGSGAAGGAVEGALYGAGEALSDAALEKDGYDGLAEKLIAGAREGAIFGGAAGGVLAGASGLVQTGAEKLAGKRGLRAAASEFAEETAVHAVHPSKKAAREIVGREREIGRELLDRGILAREGANGTEEMLERATREVAKTGDEIGSTMKRLDDAGLLVDSASQKSLFQELKGMVAKRTGEFVEFSAPGTGKRRVVQQVERNELRAPAEKAVGERLYSQLDPLLRKAESGTLTHGELHQYRRQLDDLVNWSKLDDKGLSSDLKTARGVLEKNLENSVEAQGRALGDQGLAAQYQAAKKGYAASRWSEKQLTDNLARGQANRWWSLTDTIAQTTTTAGSIATGSLGMGMVMGLLAGAANKAIRERGAGVLSVMAHRVATADTKIARSVGRFVRGVRTAPIAVGSTSSVDMALAKRSNEDREKAYERAVFALSQPAARPEMIGGLAKTAPNTAAAVVAKMETGRQYLLRNLPTPPRDPNQLIPMKPPAPDPVRLAAFARRKQIVDRPLSALKELENHTLTREHVEALKTVYPGLYQEIRGGVTKQLATSRRTPTYEQRIQIGVLFELPTDPSLKPAAIRRTQSIYNKPPPEPPPKSGGSMQSAARAFETQTQSLEAFGLDA